MTAVELPLSNEAKRMLVETTLRALRRGKRLRLSPGVAIELLRQEHQRFLQRTTQQKEPVS